MEDRLVDYLIFGAGWEGKKRREPLDVEVLHLLPKNIICNIADDAPSRASEKYFTFEVKTYDAGDGSHYRYAFLSKEPTEYQIRSAIISEKPQPI